MESINPSDIANLDFDSISFITLKTGDMIMIDNSVPKKIQLDKKIKNNKNITQKDTIKPKLSVSKQNNFSYKGKITFNKFSSKYNNINNNQILLKNNFNLISKISKNISFCYKAKYSKMFLNDIQNLNIKEVPKKNSFLQYNHNNNDNKENFINNQNLNIINNNIKSNINENPLNKEKVKENNQTLTLKRNNLNTKTEEITEEENLDMRIKRKSRNYLERLNSIFSEKNKPLVNAVISLKIPSDVNREQSQTEKEFDMMVAQLKQKRSKYRINLNDHCIYQKYYELYKENNKEYKYFNLNRIKYYQEYENYNKENERMNTNENNNKIDNNIVNNTFYGSFNNKGINKSLIGLNDTNANNKTSLSIYGEKIKTTRENKLFNSRIKEIGCNSTLICPTNNFKDKSDAEL